jgi:hypothetical protein
VQYDPFSVNVGHRPLERWLVGFCPAGNRGLWRFFGGAGVFSHCFALRYDATFGVWLMLEHSVTGLIVAPISDTEAGGLMSLCFDRGVLLETAHSQQRRRQHLPIFGLWCSATIGLLLGLPPHVALTPRRLYRGLLRRGAQPIVRKEKQDGRRTEVPRGS